jgi:hypothetical protein
MRINEDRRGKWGIKMCKILLSINPEHVANILNGSKKVEYRKVTALPRKLLPSGRW